jgi:hypothetical protein
MGRMFHSVCLELLAVKDKSCISGFQRLVFIIPQHSER